MNPCTASKLQTSEASRRAVTQLGLLAAFSRPSNFDHNMGATTTIRQLSDFALPCLPHGRPPMYEPVSFILRRPLLSLNTACAIADLHEDEITRAVENREIQYAFNVAAPGGARRCIRIHAASLRDYLDNKRDAWRREGFSHTQAAVSQLFPALSQNIHACPTVCRIVNVSREHVSQLIRTGAIRLAPGGRPHRGRDGSASVTRESVVQWLISRRILP